MVVKPTFVEEQQLWQQGYKAVIGIDEVGRGAFAGPVVTAAVIFPKDCDFAKLASKNSLVLLEKINDSKVVPAALRIALAEEIRKVCISFAFAEIDVGIINEIGIGNATHLAMETVLQEIGKNVHTTSSFVLVDGFAIKTSTGTPLKNQKPIIRGDQKSITIAAASILAKVYRDSIMARFDQQYPAYHFAKNKGYGTAAHREAIKTHGLSDLHRTSFQLEKFCLQ